MYGKDWDNSRFSNQREITQFIPGYLKCTFVRCMKSQITYTEKATKQQIKLNFIKEEFSLYIKWNNLKICLCTNNLQMFYICMQAHQQFSNTKI